MFMKLSVREIAIHLGRSEWQTPKSAAPTLYSAMRMPSAASATCGARLMQATALPTRRPLLKVVHNMARPSLV
eukprot:487183-Alexandrium_andersonii.AAC.1